jgi:catechol 2,3-dioxygenase-like lactoylglutathione lyase family enzyme
MAEFKFDHVHLRSPDPEATAQYYEKMFDAQVARSIHPPGTLFAGQRKYVMNLGGQTILIAPKAPKGATAEPPKDPYFGLEHIGMKVSDVDATVAELKAKGAEIALEPVTRSPGLRLAFVRGPQGVLIELIQQGK